MKKIAVFADIQNIYYTTRAQHKRQFNYRALWQHLVKEGDITQALAYAIDRNDTSQIKFQQALRHIGFDVKLKPYIQRADGTAKGDWDVGITIDIMMIASEVDTIILLSGDGDFAILLDTIKRLYNTQSIVYGVNGLTAKALIDSASEFRAIDSTLLL